VSRRRLAACAALVVGSVSLALATPGSAAPKGPAFGAPVKITPTGAGGYEPGVISDRFGNLYATAHKENAELVLSPDTRSSTLTRSMSWTWFSADHGKSWNNLPGPATPVVSPDVYNHNFGDEGDMATDDAGNVYFVDTNVTDITFTSWHADGLGKVTFKSHLPVVGFGEPVDDRPWVTAHKNGHVFYFGNQGNKDYVAANMGEAYGPGSGAGRYTVYASTDGGTTRDHIGTQLKDSGWCRPAAAPNSDYVYARPTTKDAWAVYGTTFTLGQKPVLARLDPVPVTQAGFPEAPGDFLMCAFDPAGKLTVTWTRATQQIVVPEAGTGEGTRSLISDIYSATSK
jgi:hypothetical protein